MFDGLKEKLGRFSDDVEEDVDESAVEEAQQADGEAPEASSQEAAEDSAATDSPASDVSTADGTPPDAEPVSEPATAAEPDTTVEADSPGHAEGDSSGDQTPAGGSRTAETDPDTTETAEPVAESEPAADTDPETGDAPVAGEESPEQGDGDDRGLAEKAKLFATGKTVIDEEDLQGHLDDLELALLGSDVEMGVAEEILDGVEANLTGQTRRRLSSTGNLVRDALREALYDVISVGQFDFDERVAVAEKPMVIIFTGVNGVGKTTSIAKLSSYLTDRGFSSVLANGDTYRAGANEQLEQHARNLDRKCISHEQGSDPAAVIYDAVEYAEANDVDVVLGDTAGRLHTNEGLMDQLEKIDRVIGPDLTLFVDEAVAGQDAVNRAREFDDASEIDGTILTKADADPQGGAAISIAHVTGKPILFLGTGQDYDDIERFDPEEIVDRLLGE